MVTVGRSARHALLHVLARTGNTGNASDWDNANWQQLAIDDRYATTDTR
jgi:hypothetical protein